MNPDIIEVLYHSLPRIINPGKYEPMSNDFTRHLGIQTYQDRVKSYMSYIPRLYKINLKDYEISGVIDVRNCSSIVGLSAICFLESNVSKKKIIDIIPYTDSTDGLQLVLLYSLPKDIHSENEVKREKAFIKFIFTFSYYLLNNFSISHRTGMVPKISLPSIWTSAKTIMNTVPLFLTYVLGVKEFGTSFKNGIFKVEFSSLYDKTYGKVAYNRTEEVENAFKLLTDRMDKKMGASTVTMIQNIGEIMIIESAKRIDTDIIRP